MEALKVGIVGAAGRGGSFRTAVEALDALTRARRVRHGTPRGSTRPRTFSARQKNTSTTGKCWTGRMSTRS